LHPYKVRRLSVAETLAIQSLPKKFALPENMTLSNMFKTVGNGVPYLASKGIAQTIIKFLETTEGHDKLPINKQLELPLQLV
jgi:DNA (cytosine-5)-methyltransferase 1